MRSFAPIQTTSVLTRADRWDHVLARWGVNRSGHRVEPGLYAPDLGGFRHSDTVWVTEDGIEILTYYPRDLESLTLEV